MDPTLLALTLELQKKARAMTRTNDLDMRLTAATMLDYLGSKIDAQKQEREMQNVLNLQDAINDLKEVRAEITRVNRAAGRTVFNPSATSALEQVMEYLKDAETA